MQDKLERVVDHRLAADSRWSSRYSYGRPRKTLYNHLINATLHVSALYMC